MEKKKRNFSISIILILLAVVFTILVKVVDVKPVGANETDIGFATINRFVFENIGVNMMWYHITDWLGLIPIFIAIVYAIIGAIQLIKRKSIFKVDKEIILLGLLYIIIASLYVFFEHAIINYRPILVDGFLEASYPSSHTLMTICICVSSIIVNKKLFKNRITKFINVLLLFVVLIIVIGRLLSGVHWFTDIIGGIVISSALLMTFYSVIDNIKRQERLNIGDKGFEDGKNR